MMRALWINDIHLDFLQDRGVKRFFEEMNDQDADCILIAGDVAQAPTVNDYLRKMKKTVRRPIFFVLGNHDYYFGSIAEVRSSVVHLFSKSRYLHWVNQSGVTRLTERTALIGHDGWGDGRLGDFHNSNVELNDFVLIKEMKNLFKEELLRQLHILGDETAAHFRDVLPRALEVSDHIVVLTHVPPFLEAAWHDGRYCDPDWLPFFSCKAAGDVLKETMQKHPNKRMTVLCGHTHSGGTSQILPNLIVRTGRARYGHPEIQDIFNWD